MNGEWESLMKNCSVIVVQLTTRGNRVFWNYIELDRNDDDDVETVKHILDPSKSIFSSERTLENENLIFFN